VRLLQLVRGFNAGEDPVKACLNDGPTQPVPLTRLADPPSASWSGLKTRVGRKKGRRCRFLQTADVMQPEALKRFCGEIAAPTGVAGAGNTRREYFARRSDAQCRLCEPMVPRTLIPQALIESFSPPLKIRLPKGINIAAEQWQPINRSPKGFAPDGG